MTRSYSSPAPPQGEPHDGHSAGRRSYSRWRVRSSRRFSAQGGGERKFSRFGSQVRVHSRADRSAAGRPRPRQLSTNDIPHSFTIDKYRIAKRVEPGRPVVFEFRADQPGRFPIYCNLALDEKCKDMHGELVVHAR